jgi:succinyl-CoA synthetase beta subunit
MRLQEHRAKAVFAEAGIPTPQGRTVETVDGAVEAGREIGFPVAVKAQVPVGGRGKAGGIRIVESAADLRRAAGEILAASIEGFPVETLLIESAVDVATELYVGITLDREKRRPVVMVSSEGGVDIESVADSRPDAIAREHVDPAFGLHPYQARTVVSRIDVPEAVEGAVADVIETLYGVWADRDATDAEINPLVVTESGAVSAVDAVLNLDDDALFRQPDLAGDGAEEHTDRLESRAEAAGLEYVRLEGSIGVVGNGAGLVMTTLDLIDHFGGAPANFLDVGGGADAERVGTALEVVFEDPNVEAVLVNIFGGITRGDEVADGINAALSEYETLPKPLVVRLTGTRGAAGRDRLTDAVQTEATFEGAVKRAIALAEGAS